MQEIMFELKPIDVFSAKGKYRVYDLSELNDVDDVLIVQMNTNDASEITELGSEISGIMNRPVIVITKDIKFLKLRKLTWFNRFKLLIKKFL